LEVEAAVGEGALPVITVITPTADRPVAWPLAERWMARQTVQPDQWIVADDGLVAAPLTMGQQHVRRERRETGGASLANNLLAAIPHVRGDIVLIMEDDDFYRPNHIEVCVDRLQRFRATGAIWLNYYNLQVMGWRRIRNSCAALCNTSFRAECLPMLREAALSALRQGIYHVDRLFWQQVGKSGLHELETVIGMKGLPGMAGIGIGHKRDAGWTRDPAAKQLRKWLGEDAGAYLELGRG
jgi:hypothetical protein